MNSIDEITHLAAMVSSNLNKVDKSMLTPTSSGPANRIDVKKFVNTPSVVKRNSPPTEALSPQISPSTSASPNHPTAIPSPPPAQPTLVPPNYIDDIIKYMADIASSLSKINKKMTSMQKYFNNKTSKYVE